ncbi:MAG: hypothetical protein M1358_08665 [Chloroflexi bacterium]|nr:hypothetical protein [Chloroflexota bacterium]
MAGLKSIGILGEFWRITRELNPQTIEQEALQQFRIVITNGPGVDSGWLRDALAQGRPESAALVCQPLDTEDRSVLGLPNADLYIYLARPGTRLSKEEADAVHNLDARGEPVLVVLQRSNDFLSDEELKFGADLILGTIPFHRIVVVQPGNELQIEQKVIPAILDALPQLNLSLARQLPKFRSLVAQRFVVETSRVNAEFALLSSIPANIPVVGALVATGADLVVLTKNQVMMLFKLAAVNERDLAAKPALVAEIAPVVGGAFLWRTLARTLVETLPGIVSAVPKTLVAAVGTYVVGSIALHYYQMGCKPDAATVARFRREGLERARSLLTEIRRRP